jgi:hypothetical protein
VRTEEEAAEREREIPPGEAWCEHLVCGHHVPPPTPQMAFAVGTILDCFQLPLQGAYNFVLLQLPLLGGQHRHFPSTINISTASCFGHFERPNLHGNCRRTQFSRAPKDSAIAGPRDSKPPLLVSRRSAGLSGVADLEFVTSRGASDSMV